MATGDCWWCTWGWPKQIAEIYLEALDKLDGHSLLLLYGPAHVVWGDENWDCAESCLDNMKIKRWVYDDLSDYEWEIIKESLEKLVLVSDEYKESPIMPNGSDPKDFPPPKEWEMVKLGEGE